jgi:glycosyltransferase involved in cell wall biosynthesis
VFNRWIYAYRDRKLSVSLYVFVPLHRTWASNGSKITVITVCWQPPQAIRCTVSRQGYKNVEHLVVDGASTDGTVEIALDGQALSGADVEPDKGLSDAMNKGLAQATGDM